MNDTAGIAPHDPSTGAGGLDPQLARLLPDLACPDCRSGLEAAGHGLRCGGCGTSIPMHEGIPLFGRFGSAETWSGDKPDATSESYQQNYQELGEATQYNAMYKHWRKR